MRRGYRHHLTHIKSTSRQNSCYHYERIGKRCWLGAWLHRRVFGLIYNWNIKSRNSKNINIFFYLNYDWMFYINILARRNRKQNTLKNHFRNILWCYIYSRWILSIKLFCSPDILRKNVSIILNIELDDPKFSNLENNLQTIRDNWDLVSYFFFKYNYMWLWIKFD